MHPTHCLGFAFNPSLDHLVVIRKNRPERFAGKLNGLGGKLEAGETAVQAMVREFREECGLVTCEDTWRYIGLLDCGDTRVACFAAVVEDALNARTQESETVHVMNFHDFMTVGASFSGNDTDAAWLAPFAKRALAREARPPVFTCQYC